MYKAKFIDGKLMLTSSDIQVGDKVQEWYGNKLYREYIVDEIYQDMDSENNFHTMIKGGNEAVDSKNCFKVVGEISPDATWVREGDEFDEDNIKQTSEIYEWEDISEVEEAFNNFFVKSLSTTSTHFNIKYWIRDKNEGDSVVFEVFKKTYQIKGPCGHFH